MVLRRSGRFRSRKKGLQRVKLASLQAAIDWIEIRYMNLPILFFLSKMDFASID
jgi:hypothetical protein